MGWIKGVSSPKRTLHLHTALWTFWFKVLLSQRMRARPDIYLAKMAERAPTLISTIHIYICHGFMISDKLYPWKGRTDKPALFNSILQ